MGITGPPPLDVKALAAPLQVNSIDPLVLVRKMVPSSEADRAPDLGESVAQLVIILGAVKGKIAKDAGDISNDIAVATRSKTTTRIPRLGISL